LISIPKKLLTDFVGTLSKEKMIELGNALLIALEIED
jgi:mRNA-degrading endonuclease toxin of MazEF toxin-antitoxin module